MKLTRLISLLLTSIVLSVFLTGCSSIKPTDMTMDIYNGTTRDIKLLHVKANDDTRLGQMQGILRAIEEAKPSDKDPELFAFYPDYTIDISPLDSNETITVILDVTAEYIQLMYPGPNPEKSDVVYISDMPVDEFKAYINTW